MNLTPSSSVTTTVTLPHIPLSRVKRIIKEDQDVSICSNDLAFVISLATVSLGPV
jgi:hypothetical protein